MNGFGLEGAKALEDALKTNRILVELHCIHCRIPLDGAPHIAAGLQVNESLVKFYVRKAYCTLTVLKFYYKYHISFHFCVQVLKIGFESWQNIIV